MSEAVPMRPRHHARLAQLLARRAFLQEMAAANEQEVQGIVETYGLAGVVRIDLDAGTLASAEADAPPPAEEGAAP